MISQFFFKILLSAFKTEAGLRRFGCHTRCLPCFDALGSSDEAVVLRLCLRLDAARLQSRDAESVDSEETGR